MPDFFYNSIRVAGHVLEATKTKYVSLVSIKKCVTTQVTFEGKFTFEIKAPMRRTQ